MMPKVTPLRKSQQLHTGFQLIKNRKTIWCMLKEVWRGKYRISFYTSIILALGLLYIILPFDFDWIPFIGWIDDGFVLFLVVKRLQKEAQRFIRAKAMERKGHF